METVDETWMNGVVNLPLTSSRSAKCFGKGHSQRPRHAWRPPPNYFAHIRGLLPERDRLASSLFQLVALRSAEGWCALHDLVALCKQDFRTVYRPKSIAEGSPFPFQSALLPPPSLLFIAGLWAGLD